MPTLAPVIIRRSQCSALPPAGEAVPPLVLTPDEVRWTPEGDRQLRERYGQEPLPFLAFSLGVTDTAVLDRARQLGLRAPAPVWDAWYVEAWTGIARAVLLAHAGVPPDRLVLDGRELARYVLARLDEDARFADQCDPFFARELQALVDAT